MLSVKALVTASSPSQGDWFSVRRSSEFNPASLRGACRALPNSVSVITLLVRFVLLVRLLATKSESWRDPMKQSWWLSVGVLFSSVALSGCELVAAIFKAGVWVGVLLVFAVLGLVIWLVSRAKR